MPDETILHFEGGLTFAEAKYIGDDEVTVMWREVQAMLSPKTRQLIQVAFVPAPEMTGLVTQVSVPEI